MRPHAAVFPPTGGLLRHGWREVGEFLGGSIRDFWGAPPARAPARVVARGGPPPGSRCGGRASAPPSSSGDEGRESACPTCLVDGDVPTAGARSPIRSSCGPAIGLLLGSSPPWKHRETDSTRTFARESIRGGLKGYPSQQPECRRQRRLVLLQVDQRFAEGPRLRVTRNVPIASASSGMPKWPERRRPAASSKRGCLKLLDPLRRLYPLPPSIKRGARELALRPPGNLVDAAKVPTPARFIWER
jgi:hypothetical protein